MHKKEPLDYILIPDCSGKIKKQRMKRAKEEMKEREVDEVLIMKGKDSNEDVLYLGKILREGEKIGIVTFPLHFKEYEDIIRKAKKEGKFPRRVKVEGILIQQTPKEFIYGELGLEEERIFEKKVDYEKKENNILHSIKKTVKKIIGLG